MPLPVSQDFHEKIKAQSRRIYGKIQVDYTDPFIDQSIQVSANENANYSYPEQVADNIEEPHGKIASLDGSWVLDGTYVLAPTPEEAEELQMGWWGSQLSDENGNYTAPYPTLSVTFAPRPIRSLQVISDSKRKEWPVNFTINLYSNDTLMHTETVTGNTEIFWSTNIERVNEITKMELIITKWSHANRQVKILEFFTSIQETYETDDILLINLLEEREVSQGSLPVGNISSNEIDIRLVNENGRFDAGNRQSPLYQLLKQNRRIKAWLRSEPAQIINPKPEGGHLWHFDRSVVSTDGIQPLSGAVYTLRPNEGRFGGAVAVEEGTTNLWSGTSNKTRTWRRNGGSWITFVSDNEILVDFTVEGSADALLYYPSLDGVSEGSYTFSVEYEVYEFRTTASEDNGFNLYIHDASGNLLGRSEILQPKPGERGRLHVTVNNPAENTSFSRVAVAWGQDMAVGDRVRMRVFNFQIEAKPFATSFVDGTRAAGRLVYPTSFNMNEGTIHVWFYFNGTTAWNTLRGTVFRTKQGSGGLRNHFLLFTSTESGYNSLRFQVRRDDGSAAITQNIKHFSDISDGWHSAVVRWSTSAQSLDVFLDGQLLTSYAYPVDGLLPFDAIDVGCRDTTDQSNTLIDELLILPYAATEEEIQAWYNSNAPFYDTEIKEWVPLGTFWSGDWTAPEGEIYVQTTGRDRLELLNQSTYSNSQVRQNVTLYDLAIDVLEDYGLEPEDYFVDEELQNTVIPYAYFTPQSHREALRKIAEASLGQCYCDRNGLIRLEGYSYLQSKTEPDIVITRDDYFMKDNPYNYMQIANYIEVETQPLRPAPTEEVYRSNEPVSINAGETISITAYYNVEPCIEPVASVEGTGTISDVTYYSWGADVKVTSSVAGEFELVINAKPLKVQGAEKVIAFDEDSIRENGRLKYTFPKNPLVQTRQQAQKIADSLLAYFKDPRRDLTVEWRGNPALLLGDRVRIVDEYGGEDFFITMQNIEYDGGLKVSMEGRKADVERY